MEPDVASDHVFHFVFSLFFLDYDLAKRDNNGNTALMMAVTNFSDHLHIIRELINLGSPCNLRNSSGWDAIDLACLKNADRCLDILLRQRAEQPPEQQPSPEELEMNYTALSAAARHGHYDCLQLLIRPGVDVNLVMHPEEGVTLISSFFVNTSIVKMLNCKTFVLI